MSNSINSSNPKFSILDFAKTNSPRGVALFERVIWDNDGAPSLILQPPQNTSNGEMFFIKEIHILVKNGTNFGNNKFQIFQTKANPQVIIQADSVIELHNHFDVDPASPLQNPQNTADIYSKLLFILPVPIQIRSSLGDRFEIRYVDSVNLPVVGGLNSAGEMYISVVGWRILEGAY